MSDEPNNPLDEVPEDDTPAALSLRERWALPDPVTVAKRGDDPLAGAENLAKEPVAGT